MDELLETMVFLARQGRSIATCVETRFSSEERKSLSTLSFSFFFLIGEGNQNHTTHVSIQPSALVPLFLFSLAPQRSSCVFALSDSGRLSPPQTCNQREESGDCTDCLQGVEELLQSINSF